MKGAPASLPFPLQSCSPALSASARPGLPLHPPRLRPHPPPCRDLLSWAWLRKVQGPPGARPGRPPLPSGLRPPAGTRRPVRRRSRRPRSPRLLWAVRSSRPSGRRSSCSYQGRSEAGETTQVQLGQRRRSSGGSGQVDPHLSDPSPGCRAQVKHALGCNLTPPLSLRIPYFSDYKAT